MPEPIQFPQRLRLLRLEKHWTPEEFARMLDSHRSTIVRYEKGDRFPNFQTLIRMASLFFVSTDYLLGITDRRRTEEVDERVPSEAQMRLREGNLEEQGNFPLFELDRKGNLLFIRLESREYMPHYASGDIWVIKMDVQPENGDQVLVRRNEKTEMRTFYQRPNGVILLGLASYAPPEWVPQWDTESVVGVLTHVIHSMKHI
jgi:transcriptional regulator with XRE-family HTH domain